MRIQMNNQVSRMSDEKLARIVEDEEHELYDAALDEQDFRQCIRDDPRVAQAMGGYQ